MRIAVCCVSLCDGLINLMEQEINFFYVLGFPINVLLDKISKIIHV